MIAQAYSRCGVGHARPNANDHVVRIQLDEIQKIIKLARALKKDRVRVTIQQGE